MDTQELNYTQAFDALKIIVQQMENDDITIDELADKIKTASELIEICKNKLSKTEADVNKIIETLS
ncbi:MAG: exodeoxyribonuclease VII small subunit [Bacteroidales bacterium]|jgi:exodeoxyribonuclease VII small subunit|nr:exodeoxyribonuclease VII small subunit [Bacteroidales bacterium]